MKKQNTLVGFPSVVIRRQALVLSFNFDCFIITYPGCVGNFTVTFDSHLSSKDFIRSVSRSSILFFTTFGIFISILFKAILKTATCAFVNSCLNIATLLFQPSSLTLSLCKVLPPLFCIVAIDFLI